MGLTEMVISAWHAISAAVAAYNTDVVVKGPTLPDEKGAWPWVVGIVLAACVLAVSLMNARRAHQES